MTREVEFDSEFMALIEELSLVLVVSKEGQQWWSCWLLSRFSRYPLCERYKQNIAMKDAENARLMKRLYLKNRKGSRFDIPDNFPVQLSFNDGLF